MPGQFVLRKWSDSTGEDWGSDAIDQELFPPQWLYLSNLPPVFPFSMTPLGNLRMKAKWQFGYFKASPPQTMLGLNNTEVSTMVI
jgi:hypothetical protein